MLKILQARLQQYNNWEIPDVQAGLRKVRATRDQIANIHWIIEKLCVFYGPGSEVLWSIEKLWSKKAREFQKNIYFCFDYAKAVDFVDHKKLENS